MLIDTHCHLDQKPLCSSLSEVLAAASLAGITRFVVPGVHPGNWGKIALLAQNHGNIFPAFGIHPMHADLVDEKVMRELAELAPSGVAIGETGLDPAYPVSPEVQEAAFRSQIRLAAELELPLLVHCRRAFQRTLQIIKEEGLETGGIMHAFSGSVEMALEFIRAGFLISVAGTVTWHNAVRPKKVASCIPLSSMVFETDAPDLTPHSFRGMPNQPAWMTESIIAVAELRGMLVTELVSIATENSERALKKISQH
ncbi:MAG: hydrolase TatD [Geobacteraceae bacterium GWC2_48_7]|nr:MAG: hydrolase TatD [Geobacteraceae bacterium GWC2_48_7]